VGKVRCLLRAWDAEVQRETVHEASRVFKDVQKAGVGCAPPTDEIEESNPGEAVDEAEMDETEQAERMAEAIGADSLTQPQLLVPAPPPPLRP